MGKDPEDFEEFIAWDPELFEKFQKWAWGDAPTLGGLISSICEWGIAHESQIKALTDDEAYRLMKAFCLLVDEFCQQAEASERALLTQLLGDVEI